MPASSPRTRARPAVALAFTTLLSLASCQGTSTPFDRGTRGPTSSASVVPIPNAPAGDAQARMGGPQAQAPPPLNQAQLQQLAERRLREAKAIWDRAEAYDQPYPAAAADLFEDVVMGYPEYEYAAEARFRQGRAHYRAHEYNDAIRALQDYMLIAPVNQHLAEVEELLYQSSVAQLRIRGAFFGLFKSDDTALGGLKFVAESFPAGNYPDDALLALGDYYRRDEDYAAAALHYRELLVRYPDSEWSFRARLNLGDTYMARDQGTPYTAGFVQVDPREPLPQVPDAPLMGPVEPAVALALEQYELFLERMDADPSRAAEYCREVAYARGRAQEARERLAAKNLDRGDWYRKDGCPEGARAFYRFSAAYPTTRAGQTAAARLGTTTVTPVRTASPPGAIRTTAPLGPPAPPPPATRPAMTPPSRVSPSVAPPPPPTSVTPVSRPVTTPPTPAAPCAPPGALPPPRVRTVVR